MPMVSYTDEKINSNDKHKAELTPNAGGVYTSTLYGVVAPWLLVSTRRKAAKNYKGFRRCWTESLAESGGCGHTKRSLSRDV